MNTLTDETLEALRKKFFPRVPWTSEGPVRRVYFVRAQNDTVLNILTQLAESTGFTEPWQETVQGSAKDTLAAFQLKAQGKPIGMIFGTEINAHWCDLSLGAQDSEGWQKIIIRSEEGENLVALANNEKLLSFRL